MFHLHKKLPIFICLIGIFSIHYTWGKEQVEAVPSTRTTQVPDYVVVERFYRKAAPTIQVVFFYGKFLKGYTISIIETEARIT